MVKKKSFVERKYEEFINKNGYIPIRFNPYNMREIQEIAPSLTTQCGSITSSSAVLILENMDIKK